MSITPFKGGRGIKAPYESTHLRVPAPIKESFEKIILTYKYALRMQDEDITQAFVSTLRRFATGELLEYKDKLARENVELTNELREFCEVRL